MVSAFMVWSEPEELIAQDPRLEAADGKFLVVVEDHGEQPAGHPDNAANCVDVDDGATAEAHKPHGIQSRGKIAQPIDNSMRLAGCRVQVKEFAVRNNRNNL